MNKKIIAADYYQISVNSAMKLSGRRLPKMNEKRLVKYDKQLWWLQETFLPIEMGSQLVWTLRKENGSEVSLTKGQTDVLTYMVKNGYHVPKTLLKKLELK